MARTYNDPINGTQSSVGNQLSDFYFQKQALIEARKEQYFGQLADVTAMPKHMGKTIKRFHYLPLLDEANINDQGIDADGVTISNKWEVSFQSSTASVDFASSTDANNVQAETGGTVSGTGPFTLTFDAAATSFDLSTEALAKTLQGATGAEGARILQLSGNIYGSSKDIGTISGKLPVLSETGGRVNRVGFKRKEIEGSIEKFGFFDEYTQESLDFDSDAELLQHINREMVNGANEITEDALQIDLINNAGVIKYAGNATATSNVDGDDLVTYGDLMRLSIDLDNNRTPKQTKVITGTRLIDTKTISGARVMYVGSELIPTLRAMTDLHNNPAFIPVQQYAAGGTVLNGEIGSIDQFRIVVVPEMLKWEGGGAPVTAGDTNNYETGGAYDVFPMLVVGDGSFTTIGFQTDGKTVKFKITHKKPGTATADRNDPFGEQGFMSIKWYYGFMTLRPERLAVLKTAATL